VTNRPSTSDNAPKPNPNTKPQTVKPNPTTVTPPPSAQVPVGYHMVEKGETLFALQRKYGTPVAKIKTLNNLKSNDIKAGQILKVKE
jgi:LysM repeat protein